VKYLAILKDSLREAVDSKVFYVSAGLSCLLIAVVACISFQPVPAEEAFKDIAEKIEKTRIMRDQGRNVFDRPLMASFAVNISDIKALTEASEPQIADYRFDLTIKDFAPNGFKRAVYIWNSPPGAEIPPPTAPIADVPDSLLEQFIRDRFAHVGNLEVTKIEPTQATAQGFMNEYRFVVETKGTRSIRGWLHDPCLLFGLVPMKIFRTTLGQAVFVIEAFVVNGIGAWIGIILGVVITAFFIPNMLRKGTVDLLLVKPVHRTTLLVYKYVGGLSFMFLNALLAVGGMWLVLGVRSGIWSYQFLLSILVLTFFFAVLYSVSTLAAVLSRSAIVAILVTCFVWFVLYTVGSGYAGLSAIRDQPSVGENVPKWIYRAVDAAHYVLPRTKDLDFLMTQLLSKADLTDAERETMLQALPKSINWGESLGACGIFIVVMLGLSCFRFARQDF
jgi:ABC-type transport system involved in multi-copper enzyme maturation permease subunit